MATLRIEGVLAGLDGDYPLEISKFTGRELHLIKQLSGVRGGELGEAIQAGDYDLIVAFAVIVLRRAGKQVDPDTLMDADVGQIAIDITTGTESTVPRPLASPSPTGNENSPGGSDEQSAATAASGTASPDAGGQPPSRPSLTGLPGSAPSATSDPETLAS